MRERQRTKQILNGGKSSLSEASRVRAPSRKQHGLRLELPVDLHLGLPDLREHLMLALGVHLEAKISHDSGI